MGRRKKAVKKAVKKKRFGVAKTFKCLRCSSHDSVTCKLDEKLKTGHLTCNVCHAKFANRIHNLTQPIDLYSQWLDHAIEAQAAASAGMGGAPVAAVGDDEDDDDRSAQEVRDDEDIILDDDDRDN